MPECVGGTLKNDEQSICARWKKEKKKKKRSEKVSLEAEARLAFFLDGIFAFCSPSG